VSIQPPAIVRYAKCRRCDTAHLWQVHRRTREYHAHSDISAVCTVCDTKGMRRIRGSSYLRADKRTGSPLFED